MRVWSCETGEVGLAGGAATALHCCRLRHVSPQLFRSATLGTMSALNSMRTLVALPNPAAAALQQTAQELWRIDE